MLVNKKGNIDTLIAIQNCVLSRRKEERSKEKTKGKMVKKRGNVGPESTLAGVVRCLKDFT